VDNAWEQEKPEARKMLLNRAESHTSGARFVGRRCLQVYFLKAKPQFVLRILLTTSNLISVLFFIGIEFFQISS